MKSSPDNFPGDEQTDALLFDYLEGELSEAEAKQLEERLATDPALRCELEYWREAYVQDQPYFPAQLEKNLLRGPGAGAFFPAFKIAVLTVVLSVWPLAPEKRMRYGSFRSRLGESRRRQLNSLWKRKPLR